VYLCRFGNQEKGKLIVATKGKYLCMIVEVDHHHKSQFSYVHMQIANVYTHILVKKEGRVKLQIGT